MRPRSLFVSLFVLLSTVLWSSASVQAQIRADASAPAEQRPTILQAGNGVPLVNIQTPSAAGEKVGGQLSYKTELLLIFEVCRQVGLGVGLSIFKEI
jgi:hypothetical protein